MLIETPLPNQDPSSQVSSLGDTLTHFLFGYPAEIICACILLFMGINLLLVATRKTITNDEILHIPSGYHYLVGGDFRLNPEHPPLVKMFAGLPLLALRLEPSSFARPAGHDAARYTFDSAKQFWEGNQQKFQQIILLSRLPMILLTLALGVLIFIFGRELFGSRSALFAVGLFSLEPTLLAHGRIVHTDVAAAFGYLLFFFLLYRYLRSLSFSRSVLLGLGTGFALVTKFSMLVLVPIFLGALLYSLWRPGSAERTRRPLILQACAAIAITLLVINASYYFQHPMLARAEVDSIVQTTPQAADRVLTAINVLRWPLPTYYLFGIYSVAVHNHTGHSASLLGNYRLFGWWYYFPVAFALKSTLAFLLLSVCALAWSLRRLIRKHEWKLIIVIAPLVLYLAFSMASSINIGIRHLAPVYPLLFLLGGAFLDRTLKAGGKLRAGLVIALFAWMTIDVVRWYPNYLTYISPLAFGKPGWQVLSDSNVEWGEDIGELAAYLHARGETQLYGSISGGSPTAEMYGIRLIDSAPQDPKSSKTRYVALGAGFLNGATVPESMLDADGIKIDRDQRQDFFDAYRHLQPEAVFGNSIYLYRMKP